MISFEPYMILMGTGNQETTINNMVRSLEQMFVQDPVN